MSFHPTHPFDLPLLPPAFDFEDKDVLKALIGPYGAIKGLDGTAVNHPNARLLISPAILRESVASSNIENIHTTLADALQNELFPETERRAPDKEVLKYRDALLAAHEAIQDRDEPIATRMIQRIQSALIPDSPGEYRKQQNRIANDLTGEVLYTPPAPPDVARLMGNLERFINEPPEGLHPLLATIIAHYQFEAIHPFSDGNGRTGRIMMVAQLKKYGLLNYPILYISGFINENRKEYYRRLLAVSAEADWKGYVLFMLKGFQEQAEKADLSLLKLAVLFERMKKTAKAECGSAYSIELIEAVFRNPVITPARLSEELDIHYMTASKYLTALAKTDLLRSKRQGRYHLYINFGLLALLKS